MLVREATKHDIGAILQIYNYYVSETNISFEEEPVVFGCMAERVEKVQRYGFPWLVAEVSGEVCGYAYASHWQERAAYRSTVEITVYLDKSAKGQGLGSQLYTRLFQLLAEQEVKQVVAGISLPNPASAALHEKFGMSKVGHFSRVGYKFGKWVDVGYWQCEINT